MSKDPNFKTLPLEERLWSEKATLEKLQALAAPANQQKRTPQIDDSNLYAAVGKNRASDGRSSNYNLDHLDKELPLNTKNSLHLGDVNKNKANQSLKEIEGTIAKLYEDPSPFENPFFYDDMESKIDGIIMEYGMDMGESFVQKLQNAKRRLKGAESRARNK